MLLLSNCSILSSPTFHEIKTSKTMRDLQQLHAQNIKTGQIRDPLVAAEILRSSALSNHRDLQYARSIFHQMEEPNCFSWNTLIRAFSESDNPLEALFIYHLMLRLELVEPNQFTFPSVLKACARYGAVEEGIQIHGQIIKRGLQSDGFVLSNLVRLYVLCGFMDAARQLFDRRFDSDDALSESTDVEVRQGLVVLWNVMVDGYLRTGAVEDARWMFNKMPQRSVVSWNGMIAGYAQNCFFEDALEMSREMQMAGVSPNYVTLVSVLPAISRLGVLGLGKWVHTYVMKKDIEMNDELVSALIDMYSKCGSIGLALQVFEEGLSRKNAATWSAIIGGLAMHGRAKEAIEHFLNMEQTGVTPTDVTFIGLLSACNHAGLVDEGRLYFSKMIRVYGLSPQIEHYGCMVDLFGRAGLLEEAEELY